MIADVHLGYEWARGSAGDCVPAHSLDETLSRLDRLLARAPIKQLIVAGDLVESARPCRRTAADLGRLRAWLDSLAVSLIVLEGNHDRILSRVSRPARGSTEKPPLPATYTIDGWTIGHGHRPLSGTGIISGHHHPVVRFAGNTAPCFLVGPGRIVLPAFSPNAAGCDVVTAADVRSLAHVSASVHCQHRTRVARFRSAGRHAMPVAWYLVVTGSRSKITKTSTIVVGRRIISTE